MVEYWLWSATHMSTGFGEVMNGSQNCFKTGGRDTRHSAIEAIASVSAISATAGILRAIRFRFGCRTSAGVAAVWALRRSASPGISREVTAGGPLGWPGQ